MKPNFALGLTSAGVTLWHRSAQGWLRVGAVALDSADMSTAFAPIMDTARKLEPDQIITKLVIPDDQVLYCRVDAPSRDKEEQRDQIRAALAGRTPYPVEELDFDWTGSGPTVDVAVVARETLIEAEDFADSQGLNPVCFVAAPSQGAFRREPFFGTSRAIRRVLGSADALQTEDAILREAGIATLPPPKQPAPAKSAAATPASAAPGAEKQPTSDTAPATGPDSARPAGKTDATGPADISGTPAGKASPASEKPAAQATPVATDNRVADAPTKASEADAKAAAQKPAGPESARTESARTESGRTESGRTESGRTESGRTESGRPDLPLMQPPSAPGGPAKAAPKTTPLSSATIPEAADEAEPATVSFKTRRSPMQPAPALTARPALAPSAGISTEIPDTEAAKAASGLLKLTSLTTATKRLGKGFRSRYGSANEKLASGMAALRSKLPGPTKESGADAKTALAEGSPVSDTPAAPARKPLMPAAPVTTGPKPLLADKPAPLTTPPKGMDSAAATPRKDPLETLRSLALSGRRPVAEPDPEAQRLTVFGARGGTMPATDPSRKAVLLIGGGAALVLLSAAVWAVYFMRSPTQDPATDLALSPAQEIQIDSPEALLEELDALREADAIESALAAPDAAEGGVIMEDTGSAELTGAPQQDIGAADLRTELDTATTPPGETEPGRVAGLRSTGLIMPQEAPSLRNALPAPAPFGTEALPPLRGSPEALALQQPTPEAETAPAPEPAVTEATPARPALPPGEEALEIEVIEGRPPVAPPEKPERFRQTEDASLTAPDAPDAPSPATAAAQAAVDAIPEVAPAPEGLPDESGLEVVVTEGTPPAVPPARPDSVLADPQPGTSDQSRRAPADDADTTEIAALTPDAGASTQADPAEALPPEPLPPGALALTALRPASRPEELSLPEEPQPAVFANATAQAVATSRRPQGRPSDFAATVQRAMRAAASPQPTQVAAAAAPAPAAAAAASAAPRIPSSASVSQEATQARAINLRQINLIGVMGTSTNRRALVRLSNGRMVTVRVGESLDGGQVTAISDTELRYIRRGRDMVLRLAS